MGWDGVLIARCRSVTVAAGSTAWCLACEGRPETGFLSASTDRQRQNVSGGQHSRASILTHPARFTPLCPSRARASSALSGAVGFFSSSPLPLLSPRDDCRRGVGSKQTLCEIVSVAQSVMVDSSLVTKGHSIYCGQRDVLPLVPPKLGAIADETRRSSLTQRCAFRAPSHPTTTTPRSSHRAVSAATLPIARRSYEPLQCPRPSCSG